MTALMREPRSRRRRQRRIEALLRELDDRRRELYRLKASGVQRAGARDLKRELLEVRRNLLDAVAGPQPVERRAANGAMTLGRLSR
jgi:hypothetical protein